jgi:hypothetical protein
MRLPRGDDNESEEGTNGEIAKNRTQMHADFQDERRSETLTTF